MTKPRGLFLLAAICASTFGSTREAHADDSRMENKPAEDHVASGSEKPPFSIGTKPVWYLMSGVTTGGTVAARDRGGYVGGEASIVRLSSAGRFFGFYGDGYYDFGIDRSYATTGVELGYKFFGIDGGGASRIGSGRVEWGATGRLFLTVGVISIYGRYAVFPDPIIQGNEHIVQIGALVKIPFAIWGAK